MDKEIKAKPPLEPKDQNETPAKQGGSEQSLTQSAVKGFGWNLSGSLVRYGAGFVINIILARLLGPEPFGQVALATIIISIGNLIVDSGLNAGLVQKKELEKNDIKYVFTVQMLLGIFIYLLIVFLAPLIAKLFGENEIIPVLRVLSFTIVLQAASQTSLGLLKRNLLFKRIQQAVIISYLIGYLLVGVPLAFSGKGVWSLVAAQLVQSFINLLIVYTGAKHPIAFSLHDNNKISRFGINILGANIANWIISNLDSALIGRYFGSPTLGLYNRAMSLAFTPVGIVVTASQGVLFSASARLQDSTETVRKAFLRIFGLFSEILVPFSICISITAGPIIELAYGSKWSEAVPFMKVLAIALPFYALMAIEGPMLAGIGKPELELRMQWIVAVVDIVSLIVAVQFSITWVIRTVLAIYILRFALMTIVTLKAIQTPFGEFAKILFGSSLLTIGAGTTVYWAGKALPEHSSAVILVFQILSGMFVWAILIIIKSKYFTPFETIKMTQKIIKSIRFHNKSSE